jgi:glutathione synthase/RimK-type ligase-like ATP-grasp enzyme
MADTILILAPEDDIHAAAVATILVGDFGVSVVRWDTGRFPRVDPVTLRFKSDQPELVIDVDGAQISTHKLRSIWWRRPSRFEFSADLTGERVRAFSWRECETFFKGALDATGVRIVNDPSAERAARKPRQLQAARDAGLMVPRTLMTNNPAKVREFWEECGRSCVYKPFTAPSWRMAETRPLLEQDLSYLAMLRHAPIIVQERLSKEADIRVSIIGAKVFAGQLRTDTRAAALDWRLDLTAKWVTYELPVSIASGLRCLLDGLGLESGSADLIRTAEGDHVFLEVNPSGQFLFLEIDTGQRLSHAFAQLLMEPADA